MKKLSSTEQNMAMAFVEWVNSFDSISHTCANIADLSDGIVLFEVLAEIDPKWFKLIRSADVGDNWVLKFNNLKKLYKLVTRFYEEVLGQATDSLQAPNLNAIAKEADVVETLKLCQMVIALAVQCEDNQTYIEKIQMLSPAFQHALMLSIEQVMTRIKGGETQSPPQAPPPPPSRQMSYTAEDERLYKRVEHEHARIVAEKEELEKAHQILIEDHGQLRYRFDELESEKEDLRLRLREMEKAVDQAQQTGRADFIMRTEIEHLKQDLERSEDRRQETEQLVESQNHQISELSRKVEELGRRAEEAVRLKDQLDEYKHAAEKLQKTENVIEKYKKKLEESADLRRQMKAKDDENHSLMERNQQLEDEYRKVLAFKTLMDSYKDQVAALELKNQELFREKNRLEYDARRLADKVEVMEIDKARDTEQIQTLEDRLREMEFTGMPLDSMFKPRSSTKNVGDSDDDDVDIIESNELEDAFRDANIPSLKHKIARLERQIKTLQVEKGVGTSGQNAVVLEHLLEDATRLKDKFEKDYEMAALERDMLDTEMVRIKENIPKALQDPSNATMALRTHIIELEKETASLRERITTMEAKLQGDVTTTEANLQAGVTTTEEVSVGMPALYESDTDPDSRSFRVAQSEGITKPLLQEINALKIQNTRLQEQLQEKERSYIELQDNFTRETAGGDESLRAQIIQLKEDNTKLQQQHKEMQVKMQKAKEFIKQQDKLFKETKANPPKDNNFEEAVTSLKAVIKSKEEENERLQKQLFEVRVQARREQQLIISAWYDLGRRIQRDSVAPRTSPTSWLAQQRQTLGKQLARK